ncbi:hypothetical protein HJ091_21360 [Vibrio parahaemolyticus]|nr:hypothetical protein [Vibrio parahaemolyticus]MBE4191250.1 hypothetical protein [Vibrio parahaemolyticus]
MCGYQFFHIETYSNNSSDPEKPTLESIVKEAMRVEGYCPHVYQPKTPQILYGSDPQKLPELINNRVDKARDKLGRRIRKDSPLLLAGVMSVGSDSNVNMRLFIDLSVRFLREKYKNNLCSVVLHLDESNPHLHFYCVPNVIDGRFSMSEIHDGIRARNECEGGRSKKASAYKKAMRSLQDDYYKQVSVHLGLTRLGPKVQRLTRKEWQSQKAQTLSIAKNKMEIRSERKIISNQVGLLKKKLARVKELEHELMLINDSGFFSNKKVLENKYLKEKLRKQILHQRQVSSELQDAKKEISDLRSELRVANREVKSSKWRFDAMQYKIELKDKRIQQLKYNNKKGYSNEERNISYQSANGFR